MFFINASRNRRSCFFKLMTFLLRLVIATALITIARKEIIFDFEQITPPYIYGTAAVVLALGITYWLLIKKS